MATETAMPSAYLLRRAVAVFAAQQAVTVPHAVISHLNGDVGTETCSKVNSNRASAFILEKCDMRMPTD